MTRAIHQDDLEAFLSSLRLKGVTLSVDHGRIKYSAPHGELRSEDFSRLRAMKGAILRNLRRSSNFDGGSAENSNSSVFVAPTTFSQEWAWKLFQLHRGSFRNLHITTRISGALSVTHLKDAVASVMERHEALRSRFVDCDGSPLQQVRMQYPCDCLSLVEIDHESCVAAEAATSEAIGRLIRTPISLSADPPFTATLFKLAAHDYVLLLLLDHMIADALSLDLLQRDLWALYSGTVAGMAVDLPQIPFQLADYAIWQREIEPDPLAESVAFWRQHLDGARRLRLMKTDTPSPISSTVFNRFTISIDSYSTNKLVNISRQLDTTLALTALATFVATLSKWCNCLDIALCYFVMGRPSPDVLNTIGFFSCPLFLRFSLTHDMNFLQLVRCISEEYTLAVSKSDFGRIAAQAPTADFALNPIFNWVRVSDAPLGADPSGLTLGSTPDSLQLEPFHLEDRLTRVTWDIPVDREPALALRETADGMVGDMTYEPTRFTEDCVSRFLTLFTRVLRTVGDAPTTSVLRISTDS